MKAASRTVGVVAGGTVGMTIGGPTLAIAGGIAGGAAADAITTKVESKIANEYRPNGVFFIQERIKKGEASASEIFDAATSIALDGVAGYTVGKTIEARAAAANKIKAEQRSLSVPKVSFSSSK